MFVNSKSESDRTRWATAAATLIAGAVCFIFMGGMGLAGGRASSASALSGAVALIEQDAQALDVTVHRGKVTATMDSGGYTYAEFEENGKKIWAAGPVTKVAVGDMIELSGALPMQDFTSKTLKKTFALIYFAGSIHKVDSVVKDALVDSAVKDGLVVADVADVADGKNDLTVTTAQTAAVGDLVLITGTLAADKDFGSGYAYSVIVENSTLRVEEKAAKAPVKTP